MGGSNVLLRILFVMMYLVKICALLEDLVEDLVSVIASWDMEEMIAIINARNFVKLVKIAILARSVLMGIKF
jgi:hypothetical protein